MRFLRLAEVLLMHHGAILDQVQTAGGGTAGLAGLAGLLDRGKLESALAQPQAQFGGKFLHEGLFDMAAAYLFHIVRNHPFEDGNKRTGLLCAAVFLHCNGMRITADPGALEEVPPRIASQGMTKAQIAQFLEAHSEPVQEPTK